MSIRINKLLTEEIKRLNDTGKLQQSFYLEGVDYEREKEELFKREDWFSQLSFLKDGGSLLDAGCNVGMNSFLLSKLYPDLKIISQDIIPEVIAFAKRLKSFLNLKNINFELKDMNDNNWKDFDCVLISYVHTNFEEFHRVYKQIKRQGFMGKIILLYPRRNSRTINGHSVFDYYTDEKYELRINTTMEFYDSIRVGDLLIINHFRD